MRLTRRKVIVVGILAIPLAAMWMFVLSHGRYSVAQVEALGDDVSVEQLELLLGPADWNSTLESEKGPFLYLQWELSDGYAYHWLHWSKPRTIKEDPVLATGFAGVD